MKNTSYCLKCEEYKKLKDFDFHPETGKPFCNCNICNCNKCCDDRAENGITIDDYNNMFDEQEGKCAICKIHQKYLKNTLNVDHCHTTGKVRGLLCSKCNHGLGHFKDSVFILENAILYIKNNS